MAKVNSIKKAMSDYRSFNKQINGLQHRGELMIDVSTGRVFAAEYYNDGDHTIWADGIINLSVRIPEAFRITYRNLGKVAQYVMDHTDVDALRKLTRSECVELFGKEIL